MIKRFVLSVKEKDTSRKNAEDIEIDYVLFARKIIIKQKIVISGKVNV